MSVQEKEQIRETLRIFFLAQETGDTKLFLKVWHPEARRFGFGSNNELYIFGTEDILANQLNAIRQAKNEDPDFSLTFLITRIKHFDIQKDNLIASATVEWQMLSMGKSIGMHYSQFHFVKSDNNWVIVNVTDRSKEL
ncbi:MAG: nuclear transport factor 2 family protein [Promethearchaeota archaeon]